MQVPRLITVPLTCMGVIIISHILPIITGPIITPLAPTITRAEGTTAGHIGAITVGTTAGHTGAIIVAGEPARSWPLSGR